MWNRREYEPVFKHHVEYPVHVLEALDLVLFWHQIVIREGAVSTGPRNAYIVNRGEVYAVFHSVALELPVMEHKHLAVCVVNGDRLGITVLGSVTVLICALVGGVDQIPFVHD